MLKGRLYASPFVLHYYDRQQCAEVDMSVSSSIEIVFITELISCIRSHEQR